MVYNSGICPLVDAYATPKNSIIPKGIIAEIEKTITDFDDKFRTSEAHQTGRLRKVTFLMEPFYKNEQVLLLDFWNKMNSAILSIGEN